MISDAELKTLGQILSQARQEPWCDFPGNGRGYRTNIGYQVKHDDGEIVHLGLFETMANAKRADVMLAVYARNYLQELVDEVKAARGLTRAWSRLMDEMEKWLKEQIDACEKLLAIEEEQGKDNTKIAEFFFSKLAYQVVLEKLVSIKQCACVSRSAVACWAIRYNVDPTLVDENGGPCMCDCHDGCDDDDFDEDIHEGPDVR